MPIIVATSLYTPSILYIVYLSMAHSGFHLVLIHLNWNLFKTALQTFGWFQSLNCNVFFFDFQIEYRWVVENTWFVTLNSGLDFWLNIWIPGEIFLLKINMGLLVYLHPLHTHSCWQKIFQKNKMCINPMKRVPVSKNNSNQCLSLSSKMEVCIFVIVLKNVIGRKERCSGKSKSTESLTNTLLEFGLFIFSWDFFWKEEKYCLPDSVFRSPRRRSNPSIHRWFPFWVLIVVYRDSTNCYYVQCVSPADGNGCTATWF